MWKISSRAIAEKPFTGYGQGNFALAYGTSQEAYFAEGSYSPQEELVAGSPEYAFNEYLQIALEWGIPVLLCCLIFAGFCLRKGVELKRWGPCGSVISLLVFAFSSYPMQLPAFVIAFLILLMACIAGRFLALRTGVCLCVGIFRIPLVAGRCASRVQGLGQLPYVVSGRCLSKCKRRL